MPTTIRPTLFIGLGGTGQAVVDAVRDSLAKTLGDGETAPGCFRFLKVDLDTVSDPISRSGYAVKDDPDLLLASIPSFSKIDDIIQRASGEANEALAQWWPKGLGSKLAQIYPPQKDPEQAFQLRVIGRAAFWLNNRTQHGYCERVSLLLDAIRENRMIDALRRSMPNLEINTNNIDVCVFSSLAGGTGCGMLIDALAVLRSILQIKNIERFTTVHAFLFLPQLFAKRLGEAKLQDPKCLAYAALKELDNLRTHAPDPSAGIPPYVERYDGRTDTRLDGVLAHYTYLFTNQNENGRVFEDRNDIAARLTSLVFLMATGVSDSINQGRGRMEDVNRTIVLDRTLNEATIVSRCYSSAGIYEIVYPRNAVLKYATHFARQELLGLIEKGGVSGDSQQAIDIVGLQLDSTGVGPQALWFKSLMPEIKLPEIGFLNDRAEDYSKHKRSEILTTIDRNYRAAKQKVEAHFAQLRAQKLVKEAESRAQSWFDVIIRNCITDPNWGLSLAVKFADELLFRVQALQEMEQNDAKGAEAGFLKVNLFQTDRYKQIPHCMLWRNREPLIRGLLADLQADIESRIAASLHGLRAALCAQVAADVVTPRRKRLSSLKDAVGLTLQRERDEAKRMWNMLTSGEAAHSVGCDATRLGEHKNKLKELIPATVALVRESISASLSLDQADLERISGDIVKQLHLEAHNILTELKVSTADIHRFLINSATDLAAPLWDFNEADEVRDSRLRQILISGFSPNQIHATLGGRSLPNIDLYQHPYFDDCKMAILTIRDGVPAFAIASVKSCFDAYQVAQGFVGIEGTNIRLPATILHGEAAARWHDLFRVSRKVIDKAIYRDCCLAAGILVKDKNSNYYTLNIKGQTIRCNGLPQVDEALEKQAANIAAELVSRLVSQFAANPDDFLSWSRKHNVPEEIAGEVRRSLRIAV